MAHNYGLVLTWLRPIWYRKKQDPWLTLSLYWTLFDEWLEIRLQQDELSQNREVFLLPRREPFWNLHVVGSTSSGVTHKRDRWVLHILSSKYIHPGFILREREIYKNEPEGPCQNSLSTDQFQFHVLWPIKEKHSNGLWKCISGSSLAS